MNKKATIQDFVFIAVVIFALFVSIIMGKMLLSSFNEKFNPQPMRGNVSAYSNITGKAFVNDMNERYSSLFDWVFLIMFIGLAIAVFVSFFMIDTHPALFMFVIIIFGFIMLVMAIIGNVFDLFSKNGMIASTMGSFTIIPYILDNFAFIMMVLGVIGIILLFTRIGRGEM